MSDSPEPARPGSTELEAVVNRAVGDRIDPLRSQLTMVQRALVMLAERIPETHQVGTLSTRINALAARFDDGGPIGASLAALERTVHDGLAEVATSTSLERTAQDRLAQMAAAQPAGDAPPQSAVTSALVERLEGLAARLEQSLAPMTGPEAQKRQADDRRRQADELRESVAAAVDQAVGRLSAAHAAETARIAEEVAKLGRHPEGGMARAEDFKQAITTSLEQGSTVAGPLVQVIEALAEEARSRQPQADDMRTAITVAVDEALVRLDAARAADSASVGRALVQVEAARRADASRLLEEVEELRAAVAGAGGGAVLEELTAMAEKAAAEAKRRDDQAVALLAAVDDRLQSLHAALGKDGEARTQRLAGRLEAVAEQNRHAVVASLLAATAEHSQAVVARLDERTAAMADLETMAPRVAAEVQEATAAALKSRVEPLVERLVEASDTLAHEGGRIEALARVHAGEARAVEARVAALFTDVAERAESAVDRSRARIAEGQVALGLKFDAVVAELLQGITSVTDRLEARLAESTDGLRAASSHQNGALLDAVTKSGQQLVEGLAEVKATLDSTSGAGAMLEGHVVEEAAEQVRAAALRLEEAMSLLALEDLRSSQALLREAVQDGAHKAELAALDVRGLRDRLAPHLEALAEATTRRAEADQAGFDAVLARLDKLLAAPRG